MKNQLRLLSSLTVLGMMFLTTKITFAQTSADSTTTTNTVPAGNTVQFGPGGAVVEKKATLANPAKDYDDDGNRLSSGTAKTDSASTVQEDKDGNKMAAPTAVEKKAGTITQFSADTIVVQSTGSGDAVSYSSTKATLYVDQNGNDVSMKTMKSGMPVTVYYRQEGDKRIVSKVVAQSKTTTSGL